MAITPVKTGNITTPPPVLKTDAKLTTQFNAATKAAEKVAAKGPSSSTPPPFYTPRQGNFRDVRTFGAKAYSTRLYWEINENQQKDSNKVFIKGSLSIDWGEGRGQSFTIDSNNSYIDKDGRVFYKAKAFGEGIYKTRYNLYSSIENGVYNALKAVKANKDADYLKDKKGNISPVSKASASLNAALDNVGALNLIDGVGLNGAGARIKKVLSEKLANNSQLAKDVRVRQAIALAMNATGVPTKLPKTSKQQELIDRIHMRGAHITNYVAGTINNIRIANGYGPNLDEREQEALTFDVHMAFEANINLRNGVARTIVLLLGVPGTLLPQGMNADQEEALIPLVRDYHHGDRNAFRNYIAVHPDMFDGVDFDELETYLTNNNPIGANQLHNYIAGVAQFVNQNQTLTAAEDRRGLNNHAAFLLMGGQMQQYNRQQ